MAVCAAVCAAAVVVGAPFRADLATLLGFVILLAGFAIARWPAIEVEVHRDSARIAPTEIPLVVGLLFLPAPIVLIAYASVVITARILRGDRWPKLLFNVSYAALTVGLTDLLARLVLQQTWPSLPEWGTVLAGFAVAHAATSALTLGFFVLLDRRRPGQRARPVLHVWLIGLLNAALAVAAAELVVTVPWGWLLVGLLAATVAAAYRAYYGLLRDQRDLGTLNDFSLRVAGRGRTGSGERTDPTEGGWQAALELAREQLNATRVVLHQLPTGRDGTPPGASAEAGPLRTVVAGRPLPGPLTREDVHALLSGPAGEPDRGVRRLHRPGSSGELDAALAARGATELLAAPLYGAHELLGVIEVHDRQSRVRGFGDADLRLVETLVSHLTTAMDNRRLLARLRHDAYHDPLTDLRNRLGFREAAAGALAAPGLPCAVLVVALELLLPVSDALGHRWGDGIVRTAGQRLRRALPDGVLAARLEGDTFAALLTGDDAERAEEVAGAVRAALGVPYPVERATVEAGAVAGIAVTWIDPTRHVDTLLQRADVAMQAARAGDVGVRSYAPSMGRLFQRRFQLITEFRGALDSGQIDVHFQPQLALPTRQVIGAEALVRWCHPEFGRLSPDEFVTVVEATGLIDSLTEFVLHRALRQCRGWLDGGLSLAVAVNLSARNLADPAFPERVAEALGAYRVPAGLLGFELTESAVMRDPDRALPVLRALHHLGVRIAVDDFGTGYSSLAYLRRLPVDEVKIDKSFVRGVVDDLGDLAVVRAIVELGHSLGLTVVAEGVEDDATLDQLVQTGCDVAQGYLISCPLGTGPFDDWLRDSTVRARGLRDETVLTLVR